MDGEGIQQHLVKLQPKFRKLHLNIYELNRAALIIQHWFFRKRFWAKRIKYVPYTAPKKKLVKTSSHQTLPQKKP